MFVVTLPASAAKRPQEFAKKAKTAGAQLLEIRGDLTPDVSVFDSPLPLIVSPRGTGSTLIKTLKPSFIDLELNEIVEVPAGVTVIRSFHDREKTPDLTELQKIANDLLATKPDIIKIATMIRSYDDLRTLDALHQQIPSSQMRVILGMGPKAHLNRMLSPLKNALTYTFMDDGDESAPGQVPISLHKLTAHCKKPKIFGLIGSPVAHSASPLIHNTLLQRHDIDGLYTLFPVERDLLSSFEDLIALGIAGYSVTSPWKRQILEFVEHGGLTSCNTVIRKNDRLIGYNTDEIGFRLAYPFLKDCSDIAILGSGGVVPSVIDACRGLTPAKITVFARNDVELQKIGNLYSVDTMELENIVDADSDAIVSALSVPVPLTLPRKKGAHAIDLRYGGVSTFLGEAHEKGYQIYTGLRMLIEQAFEQFRLFTGTTPDDTDRKAVLALFPSV